MAYAAHDALTVKGSNVASATTTDIGAATGSFVHITGTTTITGLGTAAAGVERDVVFDGALTLTHNATSLILPGGASITTAAGDTARFRGEGSGNWRCINYEWASRTAERAAKGLAIGTDVQAYDAKIAMLTGAIGVVVDFAGTSAPSGFLMCYGQNVSRTTYSALFAVIGTTHGAGDGSTTFTLPDHRGRVAAGKDNMGGSAASRLTSAVSGVDGATLGGVGGDQQMQLHAHTIPYNGSDGIAQMMRGGAASTTASNIGAASSAGSGGSQNVQPTIILNKIIFAGI